MAMPLPVSAQSPLLFPGQTLRIALDPGHGGNAPGARGPTGLLEKDVCLALARNLALRLESNYTVILTRSDDYQVELQQRAAIANQADADMLISLHTGAGYVHATRGIAIFYYADAARAPPTGGADRLVPADDPQQWDRTQQRQREFLVNISHELRAPLNAILSFLRLILDDPVR